MANVLGKRARRGFSLIEAMVAAGVLGIALIGLVELHKSSIRGTAKAQRVGEAAEVARQIAEQVAAQPFNQLPACAPGTGTPLPAPPNGCRATAGPSNAWAAPRPAPCTYFVDSAAVQPVDPTAFPDAGAGQRRFRVDLAVSQHPDSGNYPDSALLTIWVCWTDQRGTIGEVSTSRMIW